MEEDANFILYVVGEQNCIEHELDDATKCRSYYATLFSQSSLPVYSSITHEKLNVLRLVGGN